MQQYRVNYPLMIGLVVGTLVCSGAVYGLWRFQIERKSGWLISEAEKAQAAGNFRDATQYYGQYLSIHSEDVDARFRFANANVDLTAADDATIEDLAVATRILETTLRDRKLVDLPEAKSLRRRLVELYGRDSYHNYEGALDHLNLLLETDPNDSDLQVLRATYLARSKNLDEAVKYSYQLIGYDPKADAFDAKKAAAPHAAQVYSTLATILRGKDKPELAERVMDRLIEVNPDSAEAYLSRGRLRVFWGNTDGARADAEKAYQIKPEDTDVLLFMADTAARDEKFDKAHEAIAKAKKLHPKEARLYQAAAAVEMKESQAAAPEMKQKHYDKALAEIEEGVKNVSGPKAMELLFFKAELQLPAGDVKGARQTIEELQKNRNLRPEVVDYFDARIMLAEGKWFPAAEAFSKLSARMSDFGRERAMEVDYNLGLCYERLGRWDLAKDQYEIVLRQDAENEPAKAGVQRVEAQMGLQSNDRNSDPWTTAVNDILKMPEGKQDWAKLDAMLLEIAKKRNLDETTVKLIQAQMLAMRKDYDGAAKVLAEAEKLSPKNLQVQRLKVQVARMHPKGGPAKAMELLNKLAVDFGDLPSLRLDKADTLITTQKDQQDKEPLKHDLAGVLVGIEAWTVPQKVELWTGMAGRYLNLGMTDEGRQYLTLAADNQPNELPLRLALFSLALEAGDDAGMKEAQKKILDIVGDKNDSNWLYAEARRRLWLMRRHQLGKDALNDIRSLVNQALQQRPDWHELHSLMAEVELSANNGAQALQHYDKAEELGRPTPASVVAHIRLLSAYGRFADAGKLLDRVPESLRQPMLGPLYAEILFRTNQVEAALKQAQAATQADPTNAQNQYWYGQLLARSAQASDVSAERRNEIMSQATKSMQRAAELQPEFPEAWFALINYFAMQKNEDQAQKAMRDAQLVLSGDNLQIFLARSYEVLHRWFDAETMYRAIYETAPNELPRAQQLAAFYLGPLYQRPDREIKASPLINQILKAGAEAKIPANDGNLLWARRMAAKMLSTTGEYQNLLKAEKLLASNSQDGSLLIEDKLAMAEILGPRPEPRSRLAAIGLLEEVDKVQPLNEQGEIALGKLYSDVGSDWSKYAGQMEKTISLYTKSVAAREAYVRKLLARGDPRSLDKAVKYVYEMRGLAPNSPATFELTVRLADKKGAQQQVRQEIMKRLPKMDQTKELNVQQIQTFVMFANLLIDLGDLDSAEKIYRDLAAKNPKMGLELARFLGLHRSPEQCFQKLNEDYSPGRIPAILEVAMDVARRTRDKVGDKFDADIQRWLDTALRENPDSITLLIVQADLDDLQKKYDEAAIVYRKLLGRDDLVGIRRAIVLNNLSFIVALAGSAASSDVDPLKLVQEAAQIMGPNSDILDTRAVVLISRKQYKEAIRDLDLCVTDNPTASKYFHKAQAHLEAGENRAAVAAWEKAEALGLGHDALNRLEFDSYDQMKPKIDQLRGSSVTRAEPTRKAG